MLRESIPSVEKLVEPDRVHRLCYVDPDLFELELKNIFEKTWVYAGHESQVPKAADYSTFLIGRQPMALLRDADGKVGVFHNRCPHRGAKLLTLLHGNVGKEIRCSYHGWRFGLDGRVEAIPQPQGYEGTRLNKDDPQFSMVRVPC
jgi:benzoate/toluate 1,2-dioxygenase alpha subunit